MNRVLCGIAVLALGTAVITSAGLSQPPDDKDKDAKGPPPFELGQLFPPPLLDQLELTTSQERALSTIQKDVKTKLEKLLTPEQMRKVANFRPGGPKGKDGPAGKDKEKAKKGPGDDKAKKDDVDKDR